MLDNSCQILPHLVGIFQHFFVPLQKPKFLYTETLLFALTVLHISKEHEVSDCCT